MTKIITAINNPILNEELKNEENIEVIYKDIQYKEGILEILENEIKIDYIIIDANLPGEIELNKLIEKIIEKNKNIKIIIIIKKGYKNKINLDNKKIIKIFYEKNINLNKLKNYKRNIENNYKKINNNKIKNLKNNFNKSKIKNLKNNFNKLKNKKNKNKNYKSENETKIINIFGEKQVGKSMTIINIIDYIIKVNDKNCKILIFELNQGSPSFHTLFGCKKVNKIERKYQEKLRKIKKPQIYKKRINFKVKEFDEKIIEKMIIKINKNINLINYNKLLNFNNLKNISKKYNYLFIENYLNKNKIINKKIIKNSNKNILLIKPNLLGIKNSKKIIEKNNLNKINNLKIIINNYNKYSIDEKIIKNIFSENKIIGKIKYEINYEKNINENFRNINSMSKEYKKNINKIVENIIR